MTQDVYRLRSDDGSGPHLTGGDPYSTGVFALYGGGPVYPGDEVTEQAYLEPGSDQPVDPWTYRWWRMLPVAFRRLDRDQGNRYVTPWHGWNQDPRWVLSWDRWSWTNASARNDPNRAVVRLSRTFWRIPGTMGHVQVWGTAGEYDVDVTARVVGMGHQVLGEHRVVMTGEQQVLHLPFNPGGLSAVTVEVEVAMDVWSDRLLLDAVHVGNREVQLFNDLPGYADKREHGPYPLLRFMDGPGRVVGTFSALVDDLLDGKWTDPQTCPDMALPWLAMMMGVPQRQRPKDPAVLRDHLIHLDQWGFYPTGSAPAIAEVAARWLTGSRSVAVLPGQADATFRTQWDQAVLDAAGGVGRVHAVGTAPRPGVSYTWDRTPVTSSSSMRMDGAWVSENVIPNPSHEAGMDGWETQNATATPDTTWVYTGGQAVKVVSTASDAWVRSTTKVPAQGTQWTVRTRVYTEGAGGYAYLYTWGYTSTGALTVLPRGELVNLTANGWTDLEMEVDASGVAHLQPGLRIVTAGVTAWVDTWYMARTRYASPVYFDGSTLDSVAGDVWVQTGTGTTPPPAYTWDGVQWVQVVGNAALDQAATDLVANLQDVTLEQANTLVLMVRPDEVPNSDLDAFAQFVTDQGVVPAGHQLVARNATTTWEAYERAQGATWAARQAVITTWAQNDAAGLAL